MRRWPRSLTGRRGSALHGRTARPCFGEWMLERPTTPAAEGVGRRGAGRRRRGCHARGIHAGILAGLPVSAIARAGRRSRPTGGFCR